MESALHHRCDTGIVFEFEWRAHRSAVKTVDEDAITVIKNRCTRYKNGTIDRWCFHPDNTRITAMWVSSYWSVERKRLADSKESSVPHFLQVGAGAVAACPWPRGPCPSPTVAPSKSLAAEPR